MSKLINFTCEECGKTGLTEADGLEMELGFVCTECLYATSVPVTDDYLEDPAQEGHEEPKKLSCTIISVIVIIIIFIGAFIAKN